MGFYRGLRQVAHNQPFIILLIAYTVSAIGNNLPATLILFYVECVLQSQLADFFLMLYFVTGIIFLPTWIFILETRMNTDKHRFQTSLNSLVD
jgi:GPH family glycoside/pentoside/hexuronide:cation symporter